MWKEQILSGIGEDPDLKIRINRIKENVRNHSYHQFYPVSAKIRINRGLLYSALHQHKQPSAWNLIAFVLSSIRIFVPTKVFVPLNFVSTF